MGAAVVKTSKENVASVLGGRVSEVSTHLNFHVSV